MRFAQKTLEVHGLQGHPRANPDDALHKLQTPWKLRSTQSFPVQLLAFALDCERSLGPLQRRTAVQEHLLVLGCTKQHVCFCKGQGLICTPQNDARLFLMHLLSCRGSGTSLVQQDGWTHRTQVTALNSNLCCRPAI
jgi:hypothetical protein